jgi:hypothetical protein
MKATRILEAISETKARDAHKSRMRVIAHVASREERKSSIGTLSSIADKFKLLPPWSKWHAI